MRSNPSGRLSKDPECRAWVRFWVALSTSTIGRADTGDFGKWIVPPPKSAGVAKYQGAFFLTPLGALPAAAGS